MQATVLHGPYDVRVEERPDPSVVQPTDAIIRIAAACVCGSDLWPYRGIQSVTGPTPMGHEYCGIVEEVGRDVRTIRPGQFVIAMDERRAIKTLLRPSLAGAKAGALGRS